MNFVLLSGYVGKIFEIKDTTNSQVLNFTMATNLIVKGERVSQWHRVTVWGNSAKYVANYVKVGDFIEVQGEIRENVYEKDGQKIYKTEIHCQRVKAITPIKKEGQTVTTDDIPF